VKIKTAVILNGGESAAIIAEPWSAVGVGIMFMVANRGMRKKIVKV